jgi:hypothetical protein
MPKPQRPEPCPLPRQRAETAGRGSKHIAPEAAYKNHPHLAPETGDQHPATRTPLPTGADKPQVGSTSVNYVAPPVQTFNNALGAPLPQTGPTTYVDNSTTADR